VQLRTRCAGTAGGQWRGWRQPVGDRGVIAAGNSAAKEHTAALGPTLLHDWTQFGGPTMFGAAMRLLPRIPINRSAYNLILSNVPGPRDQPYFLGCRVDTMYPLGPIIGDAGLNITVMSLNGELGIGLIGCPDLLPDLWGMADAFPDALKELLECDDTASDDDYPADA
jgi:diacylglycerol O-acyltransferase / wax synthase